LYLARGKTTIAKGMMTSSHAQQVIGKLKNENRRRISCSYGVIAGKMRGGK